MHVRASSCDAGSKLMQRQCSLWRTDRVWPLLIVINDEFAAVPVCALQLLAHTSISQPRAICKRGGSFQSTAPHSSAALLHWSARSARKHCTQSSRMPVVLPFVQLSSGRFSLSFVQVMVDHINMGGK